MLANSIQADIDRLLLQWWQARSGGGSGIGCHPMWNQAARGPRAANVVPILQGEAERTDRALRAMDGYLRDVLKESCLNVDARDKACLHRTQEAKAKARKMSRATYWRWVQRAMVAFWDCYTRERVSAPRAATAREREAVDTEQRFYTGPDHPLDAVDWKELERPKRKKGKR